MPVRTREASPNGSRPQAFLTFDFATDQWKEYRIPVGLSPRMSMDGSRVAYELGGTLWVAELNGATRRIAKLPHRAVGNPPIWHADGKHLTVTTSTRDNVQQVWVNETYRCGLDLGEIERLDVAKSDRVLDLNRDGIRLLAIETRKNIGRRLCSVRIDTAEKSYIADDVGLALRYNSASDKIAYLVDDKRTPGIATICVDATGRTWLIDQPVGKRIEALCWSADGDWLAYSTLPTGVHERAPTLRPSRIGSSAYSTSTSVCLVP